MLTVNVVGFFPGGCKSLSGFYQKYLEIIYLSPVIDDVFFICRCGLLISTCEVLSVFFFSLSETRSQNTEKLSVDQAATVLLNFLQQAREGGEGNISV